MAKIKPIGDKILIKRLEAEEVTKGGIVIPDTAKDKPAEGKVIAVGTGRLLNNGQRVDFQIKKNDRVLFSSYAGNEIKIDGVPHLVMGEDEILAVVE
jgi:chaperonin GroES